MTYIYIYIYIPVNTKHINLTKEIKRDMTWKALSFLLAMEPSSCFFCSYFIRCLHILDPTGASFQVIKITIKSHNPNVPTSLLEFCGHWLVHQA